MADGTFLVSLSGDTHRRLSIHDPVARHMPLCRNLGIPIRIPTTGAGMLGIPLFHAGVGDYLINVIMANGALHYRTAVGAELIRHATGRFAGRVSFGGYECSFLRLTAGYANLGRVALLGAGRLGGLLRIAVSLGRLYHLPATQALLIPCTGSCRSRIMTQRRL